MKASETLAAARDYLIEHGWCQLVAQDAKGRVCALGAIGAVQAGWHAEAVHLAAAIAGQDLIGDPLRYIAYYNDEVAKSESDIVDIYDRAIIIAKEAEAS